MIPVVLFALALLASCPRAAALTPSEAVGRPVTRVTIENRSRIDTTEIESLFLLKPGDAYAATAVRRSLEAFDSLHPSSDLKESLNEINRQSSIAGQILPVEDALKVLEIPQEHDVKIGLTICECRKLWGGLDEMVCMHFQPVCDLITEKTLPIEKYNRYVDPEEAKEITRQASEKGCVQWVSGVPIPYVMNICNCELPYCVPLRNHLFPQLYGPALKSHYIARVDHRECNGCNGKAECMPSCSFGAMRFSRREQRAIIIPSLCFGCGVCRTRCHRGAISLVERESIETLRDEW